MTKPNFLVVMVDDMSAWMLDYMPITKAKVAANGLSFGRFYAAEPLCSPNRVSFLRGEYAHNHTVYTNDGAAERFRSLGTDKNTVATRLQSGGGYKTALIGKYLNGYANKTWRPPGWSRWVGMGSDSSSTIQANIDGMWKNTGISVKEESRWLGDHAYNFVNANKALPWFCFLCFRAPHSPYTPSSQNEHDYDGVALRKPANFDEADMTDKPLKPRH